jgi:hypothetical protein
MEVIRVAIPAETARKLRALAEREYRDIRKQAAVMLVDAVDKAASSEAKG